MKGIKEKKPKSFSLKQLKQCQKGLTNVYGININIFFQR